MKDERNPPPDDGEDARDLPEIDLRDADILDAMRHIPGYLDITT
jgi:CBS domain-containing membrane protein